MRELELIFATAHRQLRPRTPLPEIKIEFFPFAGLNHTVRLHENRLAVRLSDICTNAPTEVYQSLAFILLARLYRKTIDGLYYRTYRCFILAEDIQEKARLARTQRSRHLRLTNARGKYVDLESLFNRLNHEYFQGSLARPRLSWSARKSRYVLGRYDATHNVIFISRIFDARNLPAYVIEYVLFHEMLHLKHQSRIHASRMMVHTPEFKAEEKTFRDYERAKLALKLI
jgi:predicted metal-dependent hydrolase